MELFLLKNCSLNTVLVDENGEARYRTQTPFKFANRATTITRAQPANYHSMSDSATLIESPGLNMTELGQIHWRCFSSSILCYKGFEMPLNEYLRRSGFFCSKRTFTASDGRSYTWVLRCGQFYLRSADDKELIIARFYRSNMGIIGKKRKASLDILPEGKAIVDDIVMTFVYMDKLRRDQERRARGGG